jgi:hypothetical protein
LFSIKGLEEKVKMLRTTVLLLAIALVTLTTACTGGGSNTNSTSNSNGNANNTTAKTAPPGPVIDLSSPKATLTAFVEAVKKKDIEMLKRTLSKNTLEVAKETGMGDADKAIQEVLNENKGSIPASIETKDEKIESDKATLQAKDGDGKWFEAKFVKEGSEWKYDMFADMNKMSGSDDKKEEKKETKTKSKEK